MTSTPSTVFWLQRKLLIIVVVAVVVVVVKYRILSIFHVKIIWFADYPHTIISC